MKKAFILTLSLVLCIVTTACGFGKTEADSEIPSENSPSEITDTEKEERIKKDVTLYFPDDAVMYLVPTKIHIDVPENDFLKTVVTSIISGPKADESLNTAVSGDVKVLSVEAKDGLCTIDLSSEFIRFNTGGSAKETMAIYSIVNTLCGLDDIEKVKINIEGNENPDFGGHYTLEEPLEADTSLIESTK